MMLSFYDSKDVIDEAFPDFWFARCGVDCLFFKTFLEEVNIMKRGDNAICLILTASRMFCDFLSFSFNPPRVISSLHYTPIRLVKARVF